MNALPTILAAGAEETALRFKAMPPLWLLIMVILPAAAAIVWLIYRREGATAGPVVKRVLAGIRLLTIVFVLLLLFQPYAETSVRRLVKSHLVLLVDTSASMEFKDTYGDPARAAETARAAALGPVSPSTTSRLDLVKRFLLNPEPNFLNRLAEQFHLHIYTFNSSAELLASTAEGFDSPERRAALDARIGDLRGAGPVTFLGSAIGEVLDEFRLRDEPLAGVVVFSDGRQTGGTLSTEEAGRMAGAAQPRVPLFLVQAGDPDLPKNIHVANLRAKEVVLRGDDVVFEFTVSQHGFTGETVSARIESTESSGGPVMDVPVRGGEAVLDEEGREQPMRITARFDRPGSYALRIGIPVRPGEKIEADNELTHNLRVVDKKIKVLYVDGYPRWEYRYLKNALVRDTETILAHCLNLDADPEGVIQPMTPGLAPLQRFPVEKEKLFEYDVIIFGDVDWLKLGRDDIESKKVLSLISEFVEEGGGFMMVAGPYDSPRSYQNTPVADILPVTLSLDEDRRGAPDGTRSFNLVLTEEGRRHPIMMLEDDAAASRQIWEKDKFSAQFWYYPVERAKPTALTLARHPGDYAENRNKYGPHPIIATMSYGAGRTLFVGVDELWRLRWCFGDRYHYRFYGEAIRLLATYRLLGGNKRFKIFTDRPAYYLGDPVVISAEVFDREFNPAREETARITIRAPDGSEQEIELAAVPGDPGNYAHQITVHQEGTWLVTAPVPEGDEERPERLFKVEFSTEEMKNPLVDLPALAAMARELGGEAVPLAAAAGLPDRIPPKSVFIPSEVRSEDLWDDPWVLFAVTALLAAEWILRKRYRLL